MSKCPISKFPQLNASALTYTLFVSIIFSLVLSTLVLGAYYYKLEYLNFKTKSESLSNISSGVAMALAIDQVDYKLPIRDKLFADGDDSVEVAFQPWGAWDIVKVSTWKKSNTQPTTKYFTRAFGRSKEGKSALYLVDNNRAVSVSGDTKIVGEAYLPKAGVRSQIINGIGYKNKRLLYGKKLVSEKSMPVLNEDRLEILREFSLGRSKALYPSDLISAGFTGNNFIPFGIDTLIFKEYESKILSDSLSGRVWIHANKRLRIKKTAFLENVIVTAPIIEIDSGFVGNLQAIATDTILLRGGASLEFPSLLAVINDNPPATIQLEHNTSVRGVIVLEGPKKEFNQRVMNISDKSEVEGMVYCHGFLETNGKVSGHVSVEKFLINTFAGVYENYIFNASLDAKAISPEYAGTDLWFNNQEKKVLQWLY